MFTANKILSAKVFTANEVNDVESGCDRLIEKSIELKNKKLLKA